MDFCWPLADTGRPPRKPKPLDFYSAVMAAGLPKRMPEGSDQVKHILIEKIGADFVVFVVFAIGSDGRRLRRFAYPTVRKARSAAAAWAVAYENCPIMDLTLAEETEKKST